MNITSPPPRALPLGVQHLFESLGGNFATAMIGHPAAAGAVTVFLVTRDPARVPRGDVHALVHTALRLPSGDLLDAEGLRSFEEMCAGHRLAPDTCALFEKPFPKGMSQRPLDVKIRQIADLCGWAAGAPRARESRTATSHPDEARAEHERHSGDVNGLLEACIARLTAGQG